MGRIKRRLKKRFVVVFLIVLVVLIVSGCVGYYLYQKHQEDVINLFKLSLDGRMRETPSLYCLKLNPRKLNPSVK